MFSYCYYFYYPRARLPSKTYEKNLSNQPEPTFPPSDQYQRKVADGGLATLMNPHDWSEERGFDSPDSRARNGGRRGLEGSKGYMLLGREDYMVRVFDGSPSGRGAELWSVSTIYPPPTFNPQESTRRPIFNDSDLNLVVID